MTTKKADNKAMRARAATGTKGFPKTALRRAFETMAGNALDAEKAKDAKEAAALDVVMAADAFATANAGLDTATVVSGWRENLAGLVMELAVAGNKFADLKPGDKDKPASARLTGYGNNVASIAKGVLEFPETAPTTLADAGVDVSYRAVRVAVEAARKAAREAADPDAKALSEAKERTLAHWSDLKEAVFASGDAGLIDSLGETLAGMLAEWQEAQAEQEAMEAEAA